MGWYYMEKEKMVNEEKMDEVELLEIKILANDLWFAGEHPDQVYEALKDIENDDYDSTDAQCLTVLGNYEHGNPEIDQLVEELYERVYARAKKKEEKR